MAVSKLAKTYNYHLVRPLSATEKPYIALKSDNQQTTKIIITSNPGDATQTIYFRMRDQYTFLVGGGLTF